MLSADDLLYFKDKLEEKKRELLARMRSGLPTTDTNEMADDVDLATVIEQQHFAETMMSRDKKLLDEVEAALKRIEDDEYGYCEGSGEEISRGRLEVQPWCRYTVIYAEKQEKLQKRTGRGINDEGEH